MGKALRTFLSSMEDVLRGNHETTLRIVSTSRFFDARTNELKGLRAGNTLEHYHVREVSD